jgi:LPXTG-motif cell wall-anchored protein
VKRTATAASDKTSTTLPATGSNSSIPGIIGATLVVVGLVLATRRRLVN